MIDSIHKSKVEAPRHDHSQNQSQRHHHDPVGHKFQTKFTVFILRLILGIIIINSCCLFFLLMVLLQEWIQKQCALRKHQQHEISTDVFPNHSKQFCWTKFLAFYVQSEVWPTLSTKDSLVSDNLSRKAVRMNFSIFTMTSFYELGAYFYVFQILSFVQEIFLQILQ